MASAKRSAQSKIVADVASILATGDPTYFAFEGACRQAIRSTLCLDGWRWHRADAVSADIVADAFALIGAVRPSWDQGQPEWTHDALFCGNPDCRKPIIREPGRYGKLRYCSDICRNVTLQAKWRADHREEAKARAHAWRAVKQAEAPIRNCETCGKPFQKLQHPNRPPPRFCSRSCQATTMNKKAKHPWGTRRVLKPGLPQKHCELCGSIFRPKQEGQRFCSRNCSQKHNSRQRHRAQKLPPELPPKQTEGLRGDPKEMAETQGQQGT